MRLRPGRLCFRPDRASEPGDAEKGSLSEGTREGENKRTWPNSSVMMDWVAITACGETGGCCSGPGYRIRRKTDIM